jgi:hypothetical protein
MFATWNKNAVLSKTTFYVEAASYILEECESFEDNRYSVGSTAGVIFHSFTCSPCSGGLLSVEHADVFEAS